MTGWHGSAPHRLSRRLGFTKWAHPSYLLDLLFFVLVGISIPITTSSADEFERIAQPNDPSLSYLKGEERVGFWAVGLMAIGAPILASLLSQFRRLSMLDLISTIFAAAGAVIVAGFITVTLQFFAGDLRPYLYCSLALITHKVIHFYCSFSDPDGGLARRGYPSAHASCMTAGMLVLGLYLVAKVRAYTPGVTTAAYLLLILGPLYAAFLIAIQRTREYRHNFHQINGGMIVGLLAGFYVYFIYFPSLTHPYAYLPRNRRKDGKVKPPPPGPYTGPRDPPPAIAGAV